MNRLIRLRRAPLIGWLIHHLLGLWGLEIPNSVQLGVDTRVTHHGFGVVIHPSTTIGDRVTIFPGVVIGRYDAVQVDARDSDFVGIDIGDDVIIYPGAKIIGGPGMTRVASGSILGPNSVLLGGTDRAGTWVGVPARLVRSD